jgi:flavin reductase (DIM6/NTAB) family NADH-FMN oxidoreductase RutF
MNSNFEEYAAETTKKLKNLGLLLVSTDKRGKNNVMTIGWGLIGVFWEKPVFLVSVRPTCYTHGLIEETGEFTINVPHQDMKEIVRYCGDVSGRKHDKLSECKLKVLRSKEVRPPIIQQCTLHYECRVIHKIDVIPSAIPLIFFIRTIITQIKKVLHLRGNYRSLYFGEILAVY